MQSTTPTSDLPARSSRPARAHTVGYGPKSGCRLTFYRPPPSPAGPTRWQPADESAPPARRPAGSATAQSTLSTRTPTVRLPAVADALSASGRVGGSTAPRWTPRRARRAAAVDRRAALAAAGGRRRGCAAHCQPRGHSMHGWGDPFHPYPAGPRAHPTRPAALPSGTRGGRPGPAIHHQTPSVGGGRAWPTRDTAEPWAATWHVAPALMTPVALSGGRSHGVTPTSRRGLSRPGGFPPLMRAGSALRPVLTSPDCLVWEQLMDPILMV